MPSVGRPQPDPPTPRQAAQLPNLVCEEDEEFGLYLWTSFTTGGRRGELVGLRESRFDFGLQEVRFAANYIVKRGKRIEKTPKDGEGRLVSLDPLTCELNRGYFTRRRAAMKQLGVDVPEDAYAYSPDPAGREPWNPDTMTHRYRRYADKVGIRSSLKELRHYSAARGWRRPQHRRRATRPRRRLHHAEVLRPVQQARRPARRHGHPVPARRAPQERTAPRALPPANPDARCRRARRPSRGHRPASWARRTYRSYVAYGFRIRELTTPL